MAKSSKSNSRKPGFSLQKINNLGILALLSCITLMLYWPVQGFEFTNWDDQVYITENPMIRGLSGENIQKIFTEYLMGNYHPLVREKLLLILSGFLIGFLVLVLEEKINI